MVLTQKQRDELNKGILEYLFNNNYEEAGEKFEELLGYKYDAGQQKNPMMKNILEKKWVSIIRLQKRDMELKQEIEQLKEDIEDLKKRGALGGAQGMQGGLLDKADKSLMYNPKQKHVLSSHRANITRVAFHAAYSWVASSSEDGSAKIWDSETGELEATLKQHAGVVNSVAFDYSGQYLVTASSDMTLKIWDLQKNFICVKTLQGHDHSVSHGEFSLDNNFVLSCSRDKTIKLWEVNSGYCKKTLDAHTEWVRMVKISPNGQKFASCSNDQSIIIWNYTNMEAQHQIQDAHDNVIEILAWCGHNLDKSDLIMKKGGSQNGNQQHSNSQNNNNNGNEESKSEHSEKQLNQQNQQQQNEWNSIFLASGGRDKLVKLWNTVSGELIHTFQGNDNWVRGIGFHPFLTFMYTSSDDKSIRVWNLMTGKQVRKIAEAHTHFISSLDTSKNYPLVASGGFDFKVKIWDLKP
ncbi:WD40-repeat-containing domain [Pseudocohnilembus persalinus]|uniref:WD40-repeat-containing domain n=1 Tax=Pseudocohnilembus persalinus TaxID=266149 RepID=A0A0V0QMM0_PSEPJ|nr:WD40-repeat-containing domain [Pseudocohnilembus persalinus]|eukprot:KRX03372.1 WD40-repeat-containing domain [Pseudocohnilembus persalinus]